MMMLHKDHAETTIPYVTCALFVQTNIAQVHALSNESATGK